jgi:hypothetical protein
MLPAAARAAVDIGVGVVGPITPQTESDIDQVVGQIPGVRMVPIQPPADLDAAVKRFVAGEVDDRLAGMIVVSLPTDSFKVNQSSNEAHFTGTYEIWTVDFSTLAEDHHAFTFTDSEPIVSGAAAFLSLPAQLFVERATGKKLISSDRWQAYEAVQTRVEAKLVVATRLYLQTASIRDTQPLNMLQCARALVDRGDGDTALLVFKAAGTNNPEVRQLMAQADAKIRRARAEALLGRTLGAMAGGNTRAAGVMLADYRKAPSAETGRADAVRRALDVASDHRADAARSAVLKSDVPQLDHFAFVAMLTQMYGEETGGAPDLVMVSAKDVTIESKKAADGMKQHVDRYAAALGKAAWLMSLKCGCEAGAVLTPGPEGGVLMRAHFAPSFTAPDVGIP